MDRVHFLHGFNWPEMTESEMEIMQVFTFQCIAINILVCILTAQT